MKKIKTIVVLGMHKSGTSMIAGILEKLGVNIGKELLGSHWSNPLGHFENVEFLKLNEKILKEAGGSWNNPPEKEKILALRDEFSAEIQKLVEKEESEIWGWKDPRTNLTIELFLPYLKNPYFLVCHRDTLAIAKELKERDKMEIREGENLTKVYEERINEFFQKYPELKRLDLYYEEVTSHPEKWLKEIINFLKIKPTEQQYNEALNMIRHPKEMENLSLKMRIKELQNELERIYNSDSWRLFNKCCHIVEKFLPAKSKRREIVKKVLKKINAV